MNKPLHGLDMNERTGRREASRRPPGRRQFGRGERGSILVLTCMLLLVGTVLVTGLFALAAADYRTALASVQTRQVRYIAEAGIFRAIARLDAEPAWREGWQAVAFGGGTFSVRIEDTSGANRPAASPFAQPQDEMQPVPRLLTIRCEARILQQASHRVQIIYDLQQKKIVNWTES